MDDKFFKLDQIGETLRQGAKRWKARYNPTTGAWHLLDLWHESLISLSPDAEIPDDSPALRVLQADAFEAILSEAQRLGVLSRWLGPPVPQEPEPEKREEIVEPEGEESPTLPSKTTSPRDNTVALRALGSIERIVAIDASRRLGEK